MANADTAGSVTKKFTMGPTDSRAPRPEPSAIIEDISRLQRRLDLVKESLPESTGLSDSNIRRHCGLASWAAFIMLHTWIFQLHLDLYRFALPGIREQATTDLLRLLPVPFLATARSQAVGFAVVLSRFWQTSSAVQSSVNGAPGLLAADHVFPACVIQSTKILLIAKQNRIFFDLRAHSTVPLFRSEAFDDAAIEGLVESNMAILEPYYKVMPKVEKMVRRERPRRHVRH